jgi:phage terminase Nu1 subunit (DNA packaging protein)
MAERGSLPPLTVTDSLRLLGLSRAQFDRLTGDGVFSPVTPGRGRTPATFDPAALVAAFLRYRLRGAGALDLATERAALVHAQRERAEMDLAEKRSELIPLAEHEKTLTTWAYSIKEGVLNIAPTAVQTGVIPPAAEAALDQICRNALRALSTREDDEDES